MNRPQLELQGTPEVLETHQQHAVPTSSLLAASAGQRRRREAIRLEGPSDVYALLFL
jgi:hypothetical protein